LKKKKFSSSKKPSAAPVLGTGDVITEARLDEGLIAMAVGIRHGPNFSIEDHSGEIVDKILFSKGTSFGPDVFPKCLHRANGKILADSEEESENKFIISASDIVLDISFGQKFRSEDFKTLLEKFNVQIVEEVMTEFHIRRILRVGIVRKYEFHAPELVNTFVKRTIGETVDEVNDIALRFSKKMPIEKALIKHGTNDYKNAIFSILQQPESDEISVLLDFQRYFDPSLPQGSMMEFPKFVQESISFNKDVFLSWLNKYLLEGSRG